MDDWKEFQAIYPYTINYYYINKFSNQYGHTASSYGGAVLAQISKLYKSFKTKCLGILSEHYGIIATLTFIGTCASTLLSRKGL